MNFYDKVHELVRCFKETKEYKKYIELKEEIKKNEKNYNMLKDFKDKQMKTQMDYINTGKANEETQKELENLYSILIQIDSIRMFFEAEIRLNVMLADMNKIVGEGVQDIVEF